MHTKRRTFNIILIWLLSTTFAYSQSNNLKLNLDKEGKTYIKASITAQFWARYTDMNPGTTVNGESVDRMLDFSLRRLRMGVSAQLSPKLFVYSLFGGNNFNMKNAKKFAITILDLNAEYEFAEQFALGFGVSSWYGLSRWTTRSSGSLMNLDAPLFSLFTVNKNDNSARGIGFWAKGQIAKFDYIVSIKNQLKYGVPAREGVTDYALNSPRMRLSAYMKYEFLDNESNKTAYSGAVGTYLGKKKILNIGAGFLYQAKMMSRLINGNETFYDYKNWAAEIFYDAPINKEKGTAITTYLGYFNTDFGLDYIRNVGANGFTEGGTSFNGSGSSFPMMGTGSTMFFQLGYILPKSVFGANNENKLLQPNLAIQYSDFDALNQETIVLDFGVNLFFKGHGNKLSLNYQNRPIYNLNSSNELKVSERKGMFVLQYQISIK